MAARCMENASFPFGWVTWMSAMGMLSHAGLWTERSGWPLLQGCTNCAWGKNAHPSLTLEDRGVERRLCVFVRIGFSSLEAIFQELLKISRSLSLPFLPKFDIIWPWYLAQESCSGKYTSLCDVWSFGVLMWEIFSLGGTPYSGLPNAKAREMIDSGYRLPSPEHTPAPVYELMLQCWEYEPDRRPNFRSIHSSLKCMEASYRKWIPHSLNLDQKLNRIRVSKALLKRYEEEGDHFLDQIVTGDEIWCYHYDPSTKRASMELKRGDSPRPKKIRSQRSADLAPSDYFIFGLLKKELKGKRFDSDEDVQKVVQDFFTRFLRVPIKRIEWQWRFWQFAQLSILRSFWGFAHLTDVTILNEGTNVYRHSAPKVLGGDDPSQLRNSWIVEFLSSMIGTLSRHGGPLWALIVPVGPLAVLAWCRRGGGRSSWSLLGMKHILG
ncbi:FES [Cordylochernes scorpioides]|uniref:FES n=1 Tax=Cordylochernes scorpioides TaxID=51811 RepID=A0ABY6K5F6_9ARAC|nr:FES [Cordylochernes scorpioides]